MPKLDDFRDMIDNTSDEEVLKSGQTLLREMMRINTLREELSSLEDNITAGGKAIFYFFAEELDEDELVFAAERISGKLSRIQRKREKEEKSSSSEQEESDE